MDIDNLGNGLGYSVKEVIETCEKAPNAKSFESIDRRPGEPARLAALFTKKLMKNLDGKRNIRWNQSVEACGNGISGKGKEDKPPRNKGGL